MACAVRGGREGVFSNITMPCTVSSRVFKHQEFLFCKLKIALVRLIYRTMCECIFVCLCVCVCMCVYVHVHNMCVCVHVCVSLSVCVLGCT